MKIDEDLLLSYGAIYMDYAAKENIFFTGHYSRYYFQIVKGTVELSNVLEDGKEIILGVFLEGNSLAESLLFTGQPYPMNAVAKTDCTVLRISRTGFLRLLKHDPAITLGMLERLSSDLFYQYHMHTIVAESQPLSKIKSLFDFYKDFIGVNNGSVFKVPFTRQEIAKMVGLRVETVVRTIKKNGTGMPAHHPGSENILLKINYNTGQN